MTRVVLSEVSFDTGDATYHPSAAFTPSAAGTYWWYASYAGDIADLPAATACGAGMVKTVVSGPGGDAS